MAFHCSRHAAQISRIRKIGANNTTAEHTNLNSAFMHKNKHATNTQSECHALENLMSLRKRYDLRKLGRAGDDDGEEGGEVTLLPATGGSAPA